MEKEPRWNWNGAGMEKELKWNWNGNGAEMELELEMVRVICYNYIKFTLKTVKVEV